MQRIIFVIFIFIIAVFMYPTTQGSTVTSEFSCSNKDATTTFYSYLKEPKLQESGYTRGLKTGTFNYFENGNVNLTHTLEYYDGRIDAGHPPGSDTNSSVRSGLDVDFIGDSGISEYYAKGFFPNNRAISAFKKIWSIDYSDKNFQLGGIYKSPRIAVKAKAAMGPNMTGGDYKFDYHANVLNGYLEVKDSTGWSNRTGARMVDWNQEAVMKGKVLDVTNNLRVSSLYRPSAGLITDWLPCCFTPEIPAFESLDSGWHPPSKAGSSGSQGLTEDEINFLATGARITATSQFNKPSNGNVGYTILVKNSGNVALESVALEVTLPGGSDISSISPEFTKRQDATIFWNIGPLAPSDAWDCEFLLVPSSIVSSITADAFQKEAYQKLRVKAFGLYNGNPVSFEVQSSPSAEWEDNGY